MSATSVPQAAAMPTGPALFRQGLRPFFLLCAAWAVLAILIWVAALHGAALPEGPLPLARWHGHEMLAGVVGAALAGFVLTAIPNWTGRPAYAGATLVLLAGLFVAARLVLLPGSPVPPASAAVVALLPLPALLLTVLPALVRAATPRLFGPPALILAFWAGDLLMLGDAAGWWTGRFAAGELLCLDIALALVGLIGGRIIPAFTRNALKLDIRPLPGLDAAGMAALLAVVLVDLAAPGGMAAGAVAAVASVLALLRLSRWQGLRTLGRPILAVLHLAYLLLPVALAVKAAHLLGGAGWAANWLHLQGIGAVAMMILAVMPRATLGHTGHPLAASPAMLAAWALLPLAALLRAFGPVLLPSPLPYAAAGALWALAFGLFLLAHGPMLLRPRADGKPG
ncbi:NnrS family protein [Paracraurococcus lichenis]|uniref:NnrS family protein n=1 Tax=Paracraurococcus lichenis TaxID=3064888 RepID=A0ABT9E3Q3_9PROT|nr:NnrS family protein [Paracraurococcus sp. LOR1-02]MDO9710800.1 NnrS family protein [Paracraurococcus sp. LOR1-02]